MELENKSTSTGSSQFAQFEVAFTQLDKDKIFNEIIGRFTNGKQSIKLYEKHKEPNTLFRTVRFLHPKDIEVIRKIVEEYVPSAQSDSHSIEKKALSVLLTQMAKCDIVLESTLVDNTRAALASEVLVEKLKSGTYVLKNKNGEVLEYTSIESISPKGLRELINIAKDAIEEKMVLQEKQINSHNNPQASDQTDTVKENSLIHSEKTTIATATVENSSTKQSSNALNELKEEEKVIRKNDEKNEEIAADIRTASFKKEVVKEEVEKKVEAKEVTQTDEEKFSENESVT